MFIKILSGIASSSSKDNFDDFKDYQYNRIGRDQPAYISLLFPIICIIIVVYDTGWYQKTDKLGIYIFNVLGASVLFIPALFFLYKQLIRVISELIVEMATFKIYSPKYALACIKYISLSESERNKLKGKLQADSQDYAENIVSQDKKVRSKSFGYAIKYIRDLDHIRGNRIVFENNCIYGFFRNLVGGCALNLILYYVCKFTGILIDDVELHKFLSITIPTLWIMIAVFIPMSWYARYRHLKRELIIFINHKSSLM